MRFGSAGRGPCSGQAIGYTAVRLGSKFSLQESQKYHPGGGGARLKLALIC
jgi:hypothetical protein